MPAITITVTLPKINPHKAPGPDNLHPPPPLLPSALKELRLLIAPAVFRIFKTSFESGVFPSDWKSARLHHFSRKDQNGWTRIIDLSR